MQLGLGSVYHLEILWESPGGSTSDPQDPSEVSTGASGVGGSEIFGLELMLCEGGPCSFYVTLFSVTLLPKELFLLGREPEEEIQQSLNQPNEESLEEIVKEVETELEQEEIHLFQAKEEKIQQFQEEMRQKEEEEEAEKLHQQKEKPLRYFPFLLHLLQAFPRWDFIAAGHRLVLLQPPPGKWSCSAELGERSRIRALREEEEEEGQPVAQTVLCMRICKPWDGQCPTGSSGKALPACRMSCDPTHTHRALGCA